MQAQMNNLATSNQRLESMLGNFIKMNTASSSGTGSLPSNTVANPKGELKAITTQSGLVLDEPSVPMPPPFINSEEDERVKDTFTDPDQGEFTIKVPPPQVQKAKPLSQRHFVIYQRDPRHPHIPYPSRMNQEKQKEKDDYQKMLKSLLSNKEKLIELANTPVSENCSAVILKMLPEKLGIARDVFVPVGKFTFPADFIIVDYEIDPRVPLILGRHFLRIARALIDVHGEEMILRDGDERLTLNMRNDTLIINLKSGNPTLTSEISDYSLEEFANELALIESFPPRNDDMTPEDEFVNEPALDYSSPPRYDDVNDDQVDLLLEELADELALIDSFLPGNDDMTPEDVIKEKEYPVDENSLDDNLDDTIFEMFTDELALDYSSPPLWDDYDDNLFDHETDNDNVYDDLFDFKEEKIKESKLLIDELDLPESSDFFFSRVFNPGILIHENLFQVTNFATPDKNANKITISNASLIPEDFNPPTLYELPCHKEVPGLGILLSTLKLSKSLTFLKARWTFFLALTKRTSVSWMFRVSTFIPLDKLKKRISEERTKNQAKTNKTKHGMEKRGKVKVKSTPEKSRSKPLPKIVMDLNGPSEPI
ncbi:reverse transcriptase domain-containing protein [Tanacetum coccineum]